ncbi:MAG TPA: MBL fold metallo-hydrolase [Candidatus Dormibacteraeota bacterium]|jgi:L-ascorbate metabolism protein UlaG (beta-lactamase superfamily)|nr:MBL fold metallo-hydrolase [Candidatus Dormibacteraeota bacterium]
MSNESRVYLKPNVQVEPLVDHWYAWPHLVPPATAARNVTERHLKIMDSYISTPQIHANAVKNPKMLGGPFIDYGGKRVDEVRALRDRIRKERSGLIELSSAIASLDNMLRESAKGHSLHPLYARVPEPLQGYVELVYDLNNQPSFRLIEPLLYKSKYYDRRQQTFMLSAITDDDRPFILSTPRLAADDSFHLRAPFDHEIVDYLFRLKTKPKGWSAVRDKLDVPSAEEPFVRSLFTTEAPAPYVPYTGPGVRWRYFGHACILIETQGISMLFDPVLSYTYESQISRYTYSDLPDSIDYVLITHNHQDHVLFETLLQIRHRVKNIIVPRNGGGHLQDPSLKLILENCGFRNVQEIAEMEEIRDGRVRITGLPFFGEHADLDITSKMAWTVRVGPIALLFAADSCNIEPRLYEHIHREIGDVDALFLGMECDGAPLSWLYGPLLTQHIERSMDESRRLAGSDCAQGKSIVDVFNCKEVYVYAMGQEPWLNYIMSVKYTDQSRPIVESNRLIEACRQQGVIAERLFGEREILIDSVPELESTLPGVCCQ